MGNIELIFIIIASWNVVVFGLYGTDKIKAKFHKSRISEKILILSSVLFGAFGGIIGMVVFNHKTSKPKFRYIVPILFVFQLTCIMLVIFKYII